MHTTMTKQWHYKTWGRVHLESNISFLISLPVTSDNTKICVRTGAIIGDHQFCIIVNKLNIVMLHLQRFRESITLGNKVD